MYFPLQAYVKWSAPYWWHMSTDFIFTCKLYKPCLQNAVYKIPLYLDYLFMRRRALNVFPYISLCKMKRTYGRSTPYHNTSHQRRAYKNICLTWGSYVCKTQRIPLHIHLPKSTPKENNCNQPVYCNHYTLYIKKDSEVLHSNTCHLPVSKRTSLVEMAVKWNNLWHDGRRMWICLPFQSTWFHLWFS